jgi:hypothetical protein
MTIHVAPSIITDRSPGRPAKAARTAAEDAPRRGSLLVSAGRILCHATEHRLVLRGA